MCGIVGYIGNKDASKIVFDGLEKLEYRGYDSAGIAVVNSKLDICRAEGKLVNLGERLKEVPLSGQLAIGHTRWATHGAPTEHNAHPHPDCTKTITIVHNGIIENHVTLRDALISAGHQFQSETDSEVLAHLIEAAYANTARTVDNFVEAVRIALRQVRGAYAIAILNQDHPDLIVGARLSSPLVVGLGQSENYLASDIPAILSKTRRILLIEDGEVVVLRREWVEISDLKGNVIDRESTYVDWSPEEAKKGGFVHYLIKEIHEQPEAILNTLRGRIEEVDGVLAVMKEIGISRQDIQDVKHIRFLACGTASYACAYGKYLFEYLLKIPTEPDIGSEFRYREPIIHEKTLVIAISQSGETADTIASVQLAKFAGAKLVGIINVMGSTLSRIVDSVLYTRAGPEIAVPSTKAFITQLIALNILGLAFADVKGTLNFAEKQDILAALSILPDQVKGIIKLEEDVAKIGQKLSKHHHCFVMGRTLDEPLAREGALKLKEIAYIHAEAQPGGELKHGSITLIEEGYPVIALVTQPKVRAKMISNIEEVIARGAHVIGIGPEGDEELEQLVADYLPIPKSHDFFGPILATIYLQLLGYYAGVEKGIEVDKPKNLAKSVTVE